MQTTTRTQLKGYGLSNYLAITLTKNLTPIRKEKNTNHYALNDVITSTQTYRKRKGVKPKTHRSLNALLNTLQECQDNIIVVPFIKGTDQKLGKLAKHAYQTLSKAVKTLSDLKAEAASIKGKKNGRRKSSRKVIQT
jgi:hypothetical protein